MIGIDCTAEEPVPMTATRLPVKSTVLVRPVAGVVALALEASPVPRTSGRLGEERQPVAMMQNVAVMRAPSPVSITQAPAASSNAAESPAC